MLLPFQFQSHLKLESLPCIVKQTNSTWEVPSFYFLLCPCVAFAVGPGRKQGFVLLTENFSHTGTLFASPSLWLASSREQWR